MGKSILYRQGKASIELARVRKRHGAEWVEESGQLRRVRGAFFTTAAEHPMAV